MWVFAQEAFREALTPTELYQFSASARDHDEELSEALEEFAVDFATIRNLPVSKGIVVPNMPPTGWHDDIPWKP